MSLSARKDLRLAVLIDAENVSAKYIMPLFEEVTKFGTTAAKRIYGDWTQPQLAKWRNLLHEYAIIPVQQFRLSSGKNSTDCALIIDAMDLMYSGNYEGFCIVSSDSDFTRLACRLRESGLVVYGLGEKKTPEAFVRSCDRFITLELLDPSHEPGMLNAPGIEASGDAKKDAVETKHGNSTEAGRDVAIRDVKSVVRKGAPPSTDGTVPPSRVKRDKTQVALVKAAYLATAGEDGWANLGSFGTQIQKLSPSFDPRTFGCNKLGNFVESIDLFEIKKIPSPKNPLAVDWYLKWK
jgi:uncharacterized LabA/DUF88 family protein